MKIRKQPVLPAGYIDSDDEYDEYGDYIEKRTYTVEPQVENFQTVLQNACASNDVPNIIRALNSESVNINSHLNDSWTALMHAGFNGSLNAVTYLLQNGADPLAAYDCHNAIMCVCNCKYVSNEIDLLNCLKLIMKSGCIDINTKDRNGMTALMYACSNGWLKLVEFLIENGADINMSDNENGETALFYAVRHNFIDIVKFLLSHGADENAIDKKRQTVLRIAENKNMFEILNLLNINNDVKSETYFTKEYTYWDVVMAEFENGFNKDVQSFLEALSMEIYIDHFNSNKITFKQLLSGNKDEYGKIGITLIPHRKLLTTALKYYHTWNSSNHILGVLKNEMDSEDIAQTLAMVVRQLNIIDASLIYLDNNSNSLNLQKGQEAMRLLKSIKYTENKIFEILDKQDRLDQIEYIGPSILKLPKAKINIKDKVFVAAVVVLVLFQIV